MAHPILYVRSVRVLSGHRLHVAFSDGTDCEVDLGGELHGEVFAPLRDAAVLAAAFVDAETRTVAWPNGADLAPEFLRRLGEAVAAA